MLHAPMSKEEEEERDEALAEVADPMYMFKHDDADAEGEEDETISHPIGNHTDIITDV